MSENEFGSFDPKNSSGYTEAKDPIVFDEQCYLMLFWKDFVDYSKAFSLCSMESPRERQKYEFYNFRPKNLTLLDSVHPELVPSLFRRKKYSFDFFRMLVPSIQALLVPKIRIYKLIPSKSKNLNGSPTEFDEREMLFPNVERLNSTNSVRTDISGVGIKSFSYELEGGLPNTVELFIKCKLNMVFSSINGFFKERAFPGTKIGYKYADLVTAHDVSGGKIDNWNPIKIEVGWAMPPAEAIAEVLSTSNMTAPQIKNGIDIITQGIKDSSTSLIVNHYGHDFSIKEDGKIDLTINFMGATEKAWASKQFDIIEPKPGVAEVELETARQVKKSSKLIEFAQIINKASQRVTNTDIEKCINAAVAQPTPDAGVKAARNLCGGPIIIPGRLFQGDESPFPEKDREWWHKHFYSAGGDQDVSIPGLIESVLKSTAAKNIKGEKDSAIVDLGKTVWNTLTGGQVTSKEGRQEIDRKEKLKTLIKEKIKKRKMHPDVFKEARKRMEKQVDLAQQIKDNPEMAEEVARAQLQIKAYRRIMNLLYNSGRVHFVDVTQQDVADWRSRIHKVNDIIAENEKKTKEKQRKKVDKKIKTPDSLDKSVPQDKKDDKSTAAAPPGSGSSTDGCKTQMTAYPNKITEIYNIKRCLQSDSEDSFMKVAKQKTISVRRINFVYFSDIIDAAIESIYIDTDSVTASNIQSRSSVLIGNAILQDFLSLDSYHSVNMGHIPVSVHEYMVWFQKKVVDRQTKVWSLMNFIRDAFSDLIFTSLGEGCSTRVRQPSRPAFAVMESVGSKGIVTRCGPKKFRDVVPRLPVVCLDKARIEKIKETKGGGSVWDGGKNGYIKDAKNAGLIAAPEAPSMYKPHHQAENIFNYFYYYGEPIHMGDWTGNRASDEKVGVFHFDLAAAAGIVKSINFKKVDFQPLRAQRIVEASETLGLGGQLLDQYDADIKLYGTHYFKPGIMIYIEDDLPNSFGEKKVDLQGIIGISGYYIITNVKHEISMAKNETVLTAVWQGYGGTNYAKTNKSKGKFHTCSASTSDYFFSYGAGNLCGAGLPYNYLFKGPDGCMHGIEQDSDVPIPSASGTPSSKRAKKALKKSKKVKGPSRKPKRRKPKKK